jgi:peptide/nickel transport system ATP-binding protein
VSGAVLQLEHAYKRFLTGYGRRRRIVVALEDVSLRVGQGEIVALVGESGSGKSTLGRVVVALERLDRGQRIFEQVEYSRLPERKLRRLRQRMHLVLQDPYQSLHPGMRVARAVAEPLEIARTGDKESRAALVAEALEEVGLVPASKYLNRYPHQLSGGERQRVLLARALVGRPRLVVADEPTSMVDATLRAGIVNLIRELKDRHDIAFLVITHDLDVAGAVAERVAVMQRGRLVECGWTSDVFTSPQDPYTQMLLRAAAEVGRLEPIT